MDLRSAVRLSWAGALVVLVASSCGAPPGCEKDTDCKGTRICTAGECVEPTGGGSATGGGGGSATGGGGGSATGGGGGSATGGGGGSATGGGGSATGGGGSATGGGSPTGGGGGSTTGGGGGSTTGGGGGSTTGGGGGGDFDAGLDAGTDAGTDAGLDAGMDAGMDAGACNRIGPGVAAIVAFTSDAGWARINRDNAVLMFGCDGGASTNCLSGFPSSTANAFSSNWGTLAPGSTLRILREYSYVSSYWTRSSADGRFVAHGGKATGSTGGSTFFDLEGARSITSPGLYQPAFTPDNAGFLIHGSSTRICTQSILASAGTSITLTEQGCSSASAIGLNASLGIDSAGGLWAVSGNFVNDTGTSEPARSFGGSSQVRFTPMVFNGSTYSLQSGFFEPTPLEGDVAISPSAQMVALRSEDGGLSLRATTLVRDGGLPLLAEYCAAGAVPNFSYDERWLTFHHFVAAGDWVELGFTSATDPTFLGMVGQASNIYLLDLVTGASRPITRMNAGQRAVFPHFRSDGWLYFVVKDVNRGVENLVATNAALVP